MVTGRMKTKTPQIFTADVAITGDGLCMNQELELDGRP